MISTQTSQDCRAMNLGSGLHDYCEHCQRQVAEAEKEMGAFVLAVGRVWGTVAAARAAEYWVESAEGARPLSVDGRPNWRQLTVLASSRLAVDRRLGDFLVRDEEETCKVK